jgi:hypothetical protein
MRTIQKLIGHRHIGTTALYCERSKLLAGGRFLTMVPRFVLDGPLKDQTLRALPTDLPTTRRPVGIVTVRNRTISPVAQLFIGCTREIAMSITGPARKPANHELKSTQPKSASGQKRTRRHGL